MNQQVNLTGIAKDRSSHQKGMATLLTTVIIVLMASILIITVSRTSLTEQRLSGNEIRQRAAHEAAEAGLSHALAYINSTVKLTTDETTNGTVGYSVGDLMPVGVDKDGNNIADLIPTKTLTTGTSNAYMVRFCDPSKTLSDVSCPDSPASGSAITCTAPTAAFLTTPRIAACGWSDDGLGRAKITQQVGTASTNGTPPKNPLTAKGGVNVTGSATVTNFFTNLTIWAGQSLSNIGSAGKTFVRNPTLDIPAEYSQAPSPPTTCSTTANYVCTTDKNTVGPDVIDNDPTLSSLSADALFSSYFGVSNFNDFKNRLVTHIVSPADVGKLANLVGPATVLVTGDITTPMNFTIGSHEHPIRLVIDGNWTGGGNTTVNGFVYVRQGMDLSGNKTINGGATVAGTVAGTGSLDVVYQPYPADPNPFAGKTGLIPGTWRDFN